VVIHVKRVVSIHPAIAASRFSALYHGRGLIIPPNHLFNFSFFKGEGLCFQVFDISSWVTIVPCTQYSTCNNDHTLAVSILFFLQLDLVLAIPLRL
jgi:hypothetical protein